MKSYKVYCLMNSGLPLSNNALDALYRTARHMANNNVKKRKIMCDDAEGFITTNFESVLFVSMGGILFEGEIATVKGETKVRYFVRTSDLVDGEDEKSEWISLNRPKPSKRRSKNDSHKWN